MSGLVPNVSKQHCFGSGLDSEFLSNMSFQYLFSKLSFVSYGSSENSFYKILELVAIKVL